MQCSPIAAEAAEYEMPQEKKTKAIAMPISKWKTVAPLPHHGMDMAITFYRSGGEITRRNTLT